MDSASTDLTTVWFLVKAVFLHHIYQSEAQPMHVAYKSLFFALSLKKAWVLIAQTCPQVFSGYNLRNFVAKMAASAERERSDDRDKEGKGFLAEVVARYNYCLMTRPVLTKSVTRQVLYCSRMHNSVFSMAFNIMHITAVFTLTVSSVFNSTVTVKFVRISTDFS